MRQFRQQESGQALIEFAVYASLFVLILLGITDLALYIRCEMEITAAAGAGAAYATIPGNAKDISGITFAASSAAPDVSGMTVTVADVYACSPGGAAVSSTSTCADGYGPMMFVQVSTAAAVPAAFRWTGLSSSLALTGFASYEVPWTS